MKKILYYSFIVLALAVSGVHFAQADALDTFQSVTKPDRNTYTLLEPLPCVPTATIKCSPGGQITKFTVNQFIEYVFKFAIALAVLLATIQVIIGGFQYMGNDSYSSKNEAKARFWDAGKGLAGALASFLILQTIDPRLVQVNTQIQPLCTKEMQSDAHSICNTQAVVDFKGQLDRDLKELSANNINQVHDLQSQIDSKQARIDELTNKDRNGEILTNAELVELEQLKQQVDGLQTQQTKIIATGTANGYFRNAIDTVHKSNQFDKNGVLNDFAKSGISLEKDKINEAYTTYINSPGIDPATKSDLQFQRDFYISQVDNEAALISKVIKFNNEVSTMTRNNGRVSETIPNPDYKLTKTSLQTTKDDYTKQLAYLNSADIAPPSGIDPNLAKVKNNPVLLDQYKTTLNDRLATIVASLNSKP